VNVVVADVSGQEVKETWQLVEAGPFDGCREVVPVFCPLHVSVLVLVLYVEEPEGDDAEEENDGTLNDQEGFPTE